MRRLKESRDDQVNLVISSQEEKVNIERIKSDRTESELGFMKATINGFERKIEDEISVRLRGEDEIRKWFEQKFAMMMERLNFEERGQLDRERRIMQSLQEGLQALADIVRGVKEQMGLGLAEVHNLTLENITEVSKKNEVIRDQIFERQQALESGFIETRSKLEELSEQSFKHAKLVNETLSSEAGRMEKISSAMEKHTLS
jgi:hypothetical protein